MARQLRALRSRVSLESADLLAAPGDGLPPRPSVASQQPRGSMFSRFLGFGNEPENTPDR